MGGTSSPGRSLRVLGSRWGRKGPEDDPGAPVAPYHPSRQKGDKSPSVRGPTPGPVQGRERPGVKGVDP